MITPEAFMIVLSAAAAVVGAFAYAWRAYSDVQKLRAETERMKAQTDSDENKNMARLIEFTGRLTTALRCSSLTLLMWFRLSGWLKG